MKNSGKLVIDLGIIKNNYKIIENLGTKIGVSVKADAYGLGSVVISSFLYKLGCRDFFVANLNEGIEIRNKLPNDSSIYVLNGIFDGQEDDFISYNLTPVLNSLYQVELWNNYANIKNSLLSAILHIDTGINRLGLYGKELKKIQENSKIYENLNINYVISHLSSSKNKDSSYNIVQLNKFLDYIEYFKDTKYSLSSSDGIFLGEKYHFDLVRPGAIIYGIGSSIKKDYGIKNPVSLYSNILQIKKIGKGEYVGYNQTYKTEKDIVIGIVNAGYRDGILNCFKDKISLYIKDVQVKILGAISMDLITIDLTEAMKKHDINIGEKVEIIGKNQSPDDIAKKTGFIAYEILTSLGNRFQREYIEK